MKYRTKYIVPILLFTAFGATAQQNLFNIPSGDLTPKGKFFFQHQSNFYSTTNVESKNHLVYGAGKGFEVGVNVINLKMDWRHRANNTEFLTLNTNDPMAPMKPLVQFTAQKFFFLNKNFKTTIGTQIGTNIARFSTEPHLTHFTYNTWIYEPRSHVKFVVGPYLSDRRTLGGGNNVGIMAGFELPVHKKLLIMGDFISGNNSTAVSVLGVNYLISKRVQLCFGGLIPNPNSGNKPGFVFELNLLGFDDN